MILEKSKETSSKLVASSVGLTKPSGNRQVQLRKRVTILTEGHLLYQDKAAFYGTLVLRILKDHQRILFDRLLREPVKIQVARIEQAARLDAAHRRQERLPQMGMLGFQAAQ